MKLRLRIKGTCLAVVLVAFAAPTALTAPTALAAAPEAIPADVPLVEAARDGDLDTVRDLVRSGADVNAAQGDGMTALHWAAHRNHPRTAEILIFAGARLETRTRIGGHTPLLVASRLGSADVLELLLEAGADVHVRTTTGGATALHLAAESGSARAVQLLLDHGAVLDARDEHWGHTPLIVAAASGRLEVVRTLLAAGADVSLKNWTVDLPARAEEDGRLRQMRNRRIAFLRELAQEAEGTADEVEAEEEAEYREEDAEEAAEEEAEEEADTEEAAEEEVEEAAGEDDAEEMADAEEAGLGEQRVEGVDPDPDADSPDVDPELGVHPGFGSDEEAEEEEEREEVRSYSYTELVGGYGGYEAIHMAARHGHTEVVRELLAAGADIDAVSDGDHTSVMLMATVNGHWDLAMELLDLGADPNLASDANATPLYAVINLQWAPRAFHPQPTAHLVQEADYLEAMRRLLDAGADPNVRLSRHLWYMSYNFDLLGVDTWGATPFWRAAYGTDLRAMQLLLEYGADPTVATRMPASRRGGGYGSGDDEGDPSGLPPVHPGDPSVTPLLAASGVGYGEGYAANAHRHVPGGWLPTVRFLVEEVGLDVNARDHNGFTPLHHAAARGDVDLIRYLVEQGADVTAVSRSGLTTADMANGPAQRVPPYPRAIALLRELGSDFNDRCRSC